MKAATLSVERSITTSVTAEGNRDASVRERNSTEAIEPSIVCEATPEPWVCGQCRLYYSAS